MIIITTKTYQKALNLYQYIMPQSNHPPNMMKGILYSLMRNYHRQNSKYNDYKDMATKLYNRHVNRGWDRATIKQWILSADCKIQQESQQKKLLQSQSIEPTYIPTEEPTTNKERVFLRFEYHKKWHSKEQGASNLRINMQRNPSIQTRYQTTDNSLL